MQDRATRSLGESFRSQSLVSGSASSASKACLKPRTRSHRWGQRALWIAVSSVVFGSLIVCSELIVTNFRVMAAEPTNAPLDNVLLDFTAKWCGPCQQMSPIVSRLERQNFPIRKVDVDIEKGLTRQFNVESIPCFVLIVNGREYNRIVGPTDEKELRRLMSMLPRQNIDDSLVGKNTKQTGPNNLITNVSVKNPDDKKPLLRIPPLFNRNQDKDRDQDLALTPTTPDTVRGQNPPQELVGDGFAKDPSHVSVRIRVKDGTRLHYGSGTIIESQPGRSVLLTCGHIFRDLGKDATVEVDLFSSGSAKPQTLNGQILRFDLKSDLGLVSLPTKNQLPVIRLGAVQNAPTVKDRVVSIGCGGGERPTREDHVITAINKYLGPDNIECDGIPQQGRSGGGLFMKSEMIGVCIAADPKDKRGIYTSMKPVAQLLEKAQMGHLVPSYLSNETSVADTGNSTQEATLGNAVEFNEELPPQPTDEIAGILESATRGNRSQPAATGDYVGAEIVCIVRPKTPGAPTRVVVVNQASTRFVNDLLHEPTCSNRNDTTATVQASPAKKLPVTRTRMAKQAPFVEELGSGSDAEGPFETSFEPQSVRRKRD